MNADLKRRIKSLLPLHAVTVIQAIRWWRFVERHSEQGDLRDVCRRLMACCGTTVLSGPFKGLKLNEEGLLALCNTAGLLGTYELEIHPWLKELRPGRFERIMDIGAAEGYYAVGMALRTGVQVDAYDTAPKARRLCRAMAKLNGVSALVRTHSFCSQSTLLRLRGLRCFILSDCEGFEVSLFSEDVIRALAHSNLIIELHDGSAAAGTTRTTLEPRFTSTHKTEVVRFQQRNIQDFSELACLQHLGNDAHRAICEGRGEQEWLIAIPLQ
jgi:hypothetical protein